MSMWMKEIFRFELPENRTSKLCDVNEGIICFFSNCFTHHRSLCFKPNERERKKSIAQLLETNKKINGKITIPRVKKLKKNYSLRNKKNTAYNQKAI